MGFRYFTRRSALDSGVVGWVRNLPDGRVETVAQGDEKSLARFLSQIRKGPPWSQVLRIQELDADERYFDDFEIRR